MTNFQNIPIEIILKIMTYLDKATLLIASSVSRHWNTLIHDKSWQFLCNIINSNQDSDLMQQLEFYGWSKESHSVDSCRCISIYLDNFPFVNYSSNLEILNQRCNEAETLQPTCSITNKTVFVAKTVEGVTINEGVTQTTDILMFNREDLNREPEILKTYQDTTEVHLYSYHNTLVVLERQAVENMLTSIININNFKVSIWNAVTLEFIKEVEFLDLLGDLPQQNVHTEISDVAVVKNQLAVHVFLTNLDWLLPDEIIENPQSKNTTLFWSLDTANPTLDNITFRTLMRKSLMDVDVSDTGFIFMNDKYFCRYLSGLYTRENETNPRFATKLQVFRLDRINTEDPTNINVNDITMRNLEDCNDDSIKIEAGKSNRAAAYNIKLNSFKIINLKTGHVIKAIDLADRGSGNWSQWQFYDANWSLGNFIFVQEKTDFENLKTFQLVIFSLEEHKTGHLLNLPNYLIGGTVRSKIERTEMILPGNTIHVDMRGIVMVTEDFFVLTKF